MIFHAWRALNSAANVHRVWRDCFDRASNIFSVQTAGENEKSRESQCRAGRFPIACPPGAAVEIGMMCVDEHVTIRKRRHLFRAELSMRGKRLNHPKVVRELAYQFR